MDRKSKVLAQHLRVSLLGSLPPLPALLLQRCQVHADLGAHRAFIWELSFCSCGLDGYYSRSPLALPRPNSEALCGAQYDVTGRP